METKTLELNISREKNLESFTTGRLSINGTFFGVVSVVSEKEIPSGCYRVMMDKYNNKFGEDRKWRELTGGFVPVLSNVPGFSDILLVSNGRSEAGDIILGPVRSFYSMTYTSRYKELFDLLKGAHRSCYEIWITIR